MAQDIRSRVADEIDIERRDRSGSIQPGSRGTGCRPAAGWACRSDYDVGERGFICERWLASTTRADNAVGPEDEGVSVDPHDRWDPDQPGRGRGHGTRTRAGSRLRAGTIRGFGRLAKIYDFAARIPQHIHPPLEYARRAGRNSKDEAYYFPPDVDMGPHPESVPGSPPLAGP